MSDDFSIEQALAPVRRAMAARRLLRWTVVGAGAGAAVAATFLAGLRAHGSGPVAAVVLCLAFPSGAALLSLLFRPSLADAARRADVHFGLQDRLTTALEYHSSDEPLMALQRQQTAAATRDKPLASSAGSWLVRRELLGTVLALLVACGLLLAPSPSSSQASPPTNAEIARIRHLASSQIPSLSRNLPRSNSAAGRKAQLVLKRLQNQLRQVRTRAQALRALSVAQQKLARIRDAIKPIDQSSISALAHVLKNYVPEYHGPARLRAARALSTMAKSLNHAGKMLKARVQRDLQKAANVTRDAKTRRLLRKASTAVGHGDKRQAQKSLKQAANQLAKSQAQRQARSGLNRTSSGLGNVKYKLTGGIGKLQGVLHLQRKSKYSHEQANALSPTRKAPKGRLSGSKLASGLNGKRTSGDSGHSSDVGGHSLGKQAQVAGNGKPRRFGQVYLKGKLTQGTYNVQVGPTGQVKRLTPSGYRRIVARYASTAEDALNRTTLPSSLRTYVRRYFVVLSHP